MKKLIYAFALLCVASVAQAQSLCPGGSNWNGLCVNNPQGSTTLQGQPGTGTSGKGGSISLSGGAPVAPSTATGDVILFTDPLNAAVAFKCSQPTAGNAATATCGFSNIAVNASANISSGPTFTLGTGTGACLTTSTLAGGATAGQFLCTGTAGASTIVVNLPTAPTGWACSSQDETSGTGWADSAHATNSVTLKGTIATTSDRVTFACTGY